MHVERFAGRRLFDGRLVGLQPDHGVLAELGDRLVPQQRVVQQAGDLFRQLAGGHLLQQPYGDGAGCEEAAQAEQVDGLGDGVLELVQQYRPGGLEGERKVRGDLDDVLVDAALQEFDVLLDRQVGVVQPARGLVEEEREVFERLGEPVRLGGVQARGTAPDEGDRLVPAVDGHLDEVAVVLAPLRVARGDQDVSGAGRHQVPDVLRLVGAVEDEEPVGVRFAAAQRVAHRAQPLAVLDAGGQAQFGGEFGEPLAVERAPVGGHPPDHVVLGTEAVDVLRGQLGLADAGHPVQRHDPGAGPGVLERLVRLVQQFLAPGEPGVAPRYPAPHLGGVGRVPGARPVLDRLGQRVGGQAQADEEAPLGLVRADVGEVGGAEGGGGAGQCRGGEADRGEAVRVGGDDLAQRPVPLVVAARAELEVPVAEDHQDTAPGERQVAQRLLQRHLHRGSQRCWTTVTPRRSRRSPIQVAQARLNPAKLMVTVCAPVAPTCLRVPGIQPSPCLDSSFVNIHRSLVVPADNPGVCHGLHGPFLCCHITLVVAT